jgi:hypothetical protein
MKVLLLLILGTTSAFAADAAAVRAMMPSEVTLTTGRVLRNVQVVRWETNRVVLKYSGGVDPIAFSLFKSPTPDQLPAIRESDLEKKASTTTKASVEPRTIAGQVFVTTRGAGSYKFSGAHVYAFSPEAIESARQRFSGRLPAGFRMRSSQEQAVIVANTWAVLLGDETSLADTTTDADGNFILALKPSQNAWLFCIAGRLVGSTNEQNTWLAPLPVDSDRLDLSNRNLWTWTE